jgi:hypothetical protein
MCLPTTTPVEAGAGVLLLGGCCVLTGLLISYAFFKTEEIKPAAWFVPGVCFLIGGGFIMLGGWGLGWWGN